ncbi:MAG: hypothetical protein GXY33_13845 [Phycisphaerae bacterium]|nr:hypothetical protein [Phycisphaerae bacterium]
MSVIEIDWKPSPRKLRSFGLAGLVMAVVAAIVLHAWKGLPGVPAAAIVAAGVAMFVLARLSPPAARIVYLGLTLVTWPIGWVLGHVILAAIFFGAITPVGLIFRIIGRDALHRRFDPEATTYWTPHRSPDEVERYFRQF